MLSSRTRIFPYISRRRPRTPDERPTGANPERRESRPGSAPECSAPPRESLSASRLWSKAEERAPLARALRNGRAAHNSGGGIAARMHLGARSAPTAETLTRHLFRSLPLPWISPPFPFFAAATLTPDCRTPRHGARLKARAFAVSARRRSDRAAFSRGRIDGRCTGAVRRGVAP